MSERKSGRVRGGEETKEEDKKRRKRRDERKRGEAAGVDEEQRKGQWVKERGRAIQEGGGECNGVSISFSPSLYTYGSASVSPQLPPSTEDELSGGEGANLARGCIGSYAGSE
jgi:hypothetical protein